MTSVRKRRQFWITLVLGVSIGLLIMVGRGPGPLSLPCPRNGMVVDRRTGLPVAGATLTVTWQVYDYPMLDGDGSRTVEASATTDSGGVFTIPEPTQRRGFWNTETYPPIVRAPGYRTFTLADWPKHVRYEAGQVIISMDPDDRGSGGP